MIYIIIHETSEFLGFTTLKNKDIVFVSTDEDRAKKAFDDYKALGHNNHYDYEMYILYAYPDMFDINYPFKSSEELRVILDQIDYE